MSDLFATVSFTAKLIAFYIRISSLNTAIARTRRPEKLRRSCRKPFNERREKSNAKKQREKPSIYFRRLLAPFTFRASFIFEISRACNRKEYARKTVIDSIQSKARKTNLCRNTNEVNFPTRSKTRRAASCMSENRSSKRKTANSVRFGGCVSLRQQAVLPKF